MYLRAVLWCASLRRMHLRGTKDYVLFLSRFRRASERAHPITFVQTAALCLLRKRPLLNLYRPRKISPSRVVSRTLRHKKEPSTRTTRITLWTIKFECVVGRARAISENAGDDASECSLLFISQSEMQRIIHITWRMALDVAASGA